MARKNYNWHGCDVSNSVSLFEQGFIMRDLPNTEESEIVYIAGLNDYGDYKFAYDYFSYKEWKEDCIKNRGTEKFPSITPLAELRGIDEDEYIANMDKESFIFDLFAYYGEENIFGRCYETIGEKELRRKLGRALPRS